jgi:hypothetical protein
MRKEQKKRRGGFLVAKIASSRHGSEKAQGKSVPLS